MPLLDSVLTLHRHLGDSPVAVDLKILKIPPDERRAPVRLLAGLSPEGEELWAVRYLPGGRFVLQLGTAGHRETCYGYATSMDLALNYNPMTGGISLVVSEPIDKREVLVGTARCAWAQPDVDKSDWQLVLGCEDDGRADLPPRGWLVQWAFRSGGLERITTPRGGAWWALPAGTLVKMSEELQDLADHNNRSLAIDVTANRLLDRTKELLAVSGRHALGAEAPSRQIHALARAVAEEFETVRRGLRVAGGGE